MSAPGPLLTLEPLIDAVRAGVEGAGWAMSGLQKTTSHQFEGRWEGESTRSAYLFFHRPTGWESVGVDVYLDETTRGLQATLSLVVEAPPLESLGGVAAALAQLGAAAAACLPAGVPAPISLSARLPGPTSDPGASEVEVRFKLRVPPSALGQGEASVAELARSFVVAFEGLLDDPSVTRILRPE